MNDEEKKAIKHLNQIKYYGTIRSLKADKDIEIILNLIEKQQKEIEKYKKVIDNRDFTWKQKYEETFEYVNKEFISKDKIREKIKEYKGLKEIDKMAYEEQIKPLQELLKEE